LNQNFVALTGHFKLGIPELRFEKAREALSLLSKRLADLPPLGKGATKAVKAECFTGKSNLLQTSQRV
jgi:hypothetical protein